MKTKIFRILVAAASLAALMESIGAPPKWTHGAFPW